MADEEILNVYIDESGHTGDLVVDSDGIKDFHGQPIFVLVGVSIPQEKLNDIENYIQELKRNFDISSRELKSRALFSRKHEFIPDLINKLILDGCNIFIELVDKKYFYIALIIDYLIFEPNPTNLKTNLDVFARWELADKLHQVLKDETLKEYSQVCKKRDKQSFYNFYLSFKNDLIQRCQDNYFRDILLFLNLHVDTLLIMDERKKQDIFKTFLPPFDLTIEGEKETVLFPNRTSLTNIRV